MDAALEVFAEKGLRNATMDDVAEKAELSKGTLYLYFKSKEHIFFGIDMRAARMLSERFAEAAKSEEIGLYKVRAIGRAYYKFCFDFPNYFKAMSYVERMDAQTFKSIADDLYPQGMGGHQDSSLGILAKAIEEGQKDGSIATDIEPWTMSVLLWSTSNGVIQMLKNRGDYYKLLGFPMDALYPAKEKLVERGLQPPHNG